MKQEACYRMNEHELPDVVIAAFRKNDALRCSNGTFFSGVPEEIQKQIAAWEKKYHNLVYHVIHSKMITPWGAYEIYDCLSVSCYRDDWDYERGLIDDDWVMSHGINVTKPEYTESGSIKIENHSGVLKRVV